MAATGNGDRRQSLFLLLGAAIATVTIWQIPFGHLLLYPFTILSTWFHEMGHGLTALLLGGNFERLELFANGSGLATHSGAVWGGRLGRALVAAGGPLGPAIAGAILIVMARWRRASRGTLAILAGVLLLSLIWMRSLFGVLAVVAWAGAIALVCLRGSRGAQAFAVPFLGVQACISTFNQLDYLFSQEAVIGGQRFLSDSGQIARQLWLPFWFWGLCLGVLTLGLLAGSLWLTYGDSVQSLAARSQRSNPR
ncbi:M50 family metallopeptidase [Synechococcus sp. PCC 7336]|uniref:M50 family metallopeptidase n=1 Tax=Synechococcus sp. PCC 7336 TaxID=195250 RepID=UPI00035D63F8|nr:M50 family metallopeptidase [Synechococcus sp. PCC 7336]